MTLETLKPLIYIALATLSLAFLASCGAGQRAKDAEREFPPTGQILDVEGVRIHARVEGNGPDLVLIHGASGSTRDMAFTLLPLLKDRYRVILFDRPGLGYSGRTDPAYEAAFTNKAESPQEQAEVLVKAAKMLGADRPIVLGHSYGGAVALAWATYHPENIAGLVDVAGVALPWPGTLGPLYQINGSALGGAIVVPLISALTPQSVVKAAINGLFEPETPPQGYADAVGAPLTLRTETFRANARQVNSLRPHIVEMSKDYDRLAGLPIEIIHGTADDTVPIQIHSRPLAERLPHIRLTEIEGGSHMIHHTHPKSIIQAIDRTARAAGLR